MIVMVYSEFLWTFLTVALTTTIEASAQATGPNRKTKALITPPPRWAFCKTIICLS